MDFPSRLAAVWPADWSVNAMLDERSSIGSLAGDIRARNSASTPETVEPDWPVPVALEKLTAAVAALRVLEVRRLVLLLPKDTGRSFRRPACQRSGSRGNADGVGNDDDGDGAGSGVVLQFGRLKGTNLNAVGGLVASGVERVWATYETSEAGLVGTTL